jgi:hypothetical protein
VRIWGSNSAVAEDSVLLGCYIMSGGTVPHIKRSCRACTQTTTQHHIPEERDLLSQRKCMSYHTIPLHTHNNVIIKKSYHDLQRRPSVTNGLSWSAETDPQVQLDDHDLQTQTLSHKWIIMICRDQTSVTNWWSWSAGTGFQVQTDDHYLQRHTLRYCTKEWPLSAETGPQVQMEDHDLQKQNLT